MLTNLSEHTELLEELDSGNTTGRVLVVDDEERNRTILRDTLTEQGHSVEEAEDGDEALQTARKNPPDVILLDVMMPRMDGFEVCRRIRKDPRLKAVVVIMVTALSERDERLTGIKCGANDFLTKPIDIRDTMLRVRNAVRSKRLYDECRKSYRELKKVSKLQEDLTHMIVHDMRAPLTAMMGYLDFMAMNDPDTLADNSRQMLDRVRENAEGLKYMVDSLLDVSRLEEGEMPLDLQPCEVNALIERMAEKARNAPVGVECVTTPNSAPIEVKADISLISRVLSNLLDNAIKFTPPDKSVEIGAETSGGGVRIYVADHGPGVPEEYRERVFEKFGQVEGGDRKASSGLGLTFCKLAVERHGGKIGIADREGGGSVFWFTLPL